MANRSFVPKANLNSKHIHLTRRIRFQMNRIRSCDLPAKRWIDDLDVTSRQQTWIVRLSTEAEDECAILTSVPAHTWSAYLCVFQSFVEVHARDSTNPSSYQLCLQIRIQLHRHRGSWRSHVKIINGTIDRVFDGHWTCILVNQLEWQCTIQLVRRTVGISWPSPL